MKDNLLGRAEARIDKEEVQRIVIFAFSFMSNHGSLLERFLEMTGLDWQDIRDVFHEEAFQIGLLQFLCEREENLLDFSSETRIAPAAVDLAINYLSHLHQEETI